MTYEEVWKEQIKWLVDGLGYLELQLEKSSDEIESTRIVAKMEGMRIALDHMIVAEKLYNMHSSTHS